MMTALQLLYKLSIEKLRNLTKRSGYIVILIETNLLFLSLQYQTLIELYKLGHNPINFHSGLH